MELKSFMNAQVCICRNSKEMIQHETDDRCSVWSLPAAEIFPIWQNVCLSHIQQNKASNIYLHVNSVVLMLHVVELSLSEISWSKTIYIQFKHCTFQAWWVLKYKQALYLWPLLCSILTLFPRPLRLFICFPPFNSTTTSEELHASAGAGVGPCEWNQPGGGSRGLQRGPEGSGDAGAHFHTSHPKSPAPLQQWV